MDAPELIPIHSPALQALGGEFATIVADPPWPIDRPGHPGVNDFNNPRRKVDNTPLPYPTLTVAEIAALKPPAAAAAHLYLWTINAHVVDAYTIARAWQFRPVTLLVWIKAPMGIGPGGIFSNTAEFCLFARRGRLKQKRRVDRTWFAWKRGRHSEKPEAFQTLVESVSPGPYLEMFARRRRDGWSVWGNEIAADRNEIAV